MNITLHEKIGGHTYEKAAGDNLAHALDRLMADLYAQLMSGDMENGGKGSLWRCAAEIYDTLAAGGHYSYADTEWWLTTDGEIEFKDGRTIYRKTLYVPKAECDKYNALLNMKCGAEKTIKKVEEVRDEYPVVYTERFADGTNVDVKITAYDDSFGVDSCLFDKNGCAISNPTDVQSKLDGTFEFSEGSVDYVLKVVSWDVKDGDNVLWTDPDDGKCTEICRVDSVRIDGDGVTQLTLTPLSDISSNAGGTEVYANECEPSL